jgi:DHA1 family tetracycline resistance protein-like MFS transporter
VPHEKKTNSQMSSSKRSAAVGFVMVTALLDVMGIGLIIPVLPALVGEFTASREMQSYWYGMLAASYGLMNFFASPLLGALSDRYGRRPVLLISVFGLGLDFLLQALAPTLFWLLVARLIGGVTGAGFTVASAYVADVTPPEKRSAAFGMLGATFGVGFIIGPVVGGLLGAHDVRWPFYAAAMLSGLNWLYGMFVLPESLPAERRSAVQWRKLNPFSAMLGLREAKGVGTLVVVFTLTNLAQFILHSTWVLYTGFRFNWGPGQNGVALFVVGLASALVQGLLLGRLLKWLGEARLTIAGLASGMVAFLAYGLAQQGWVMYVIIFANLLSFAVAPALQSVISKSFDASRQGVTMGSLSAISSMILVIAPLIGTAMLAQVSHLPAGDWRIGSTFYLSSALQAVALWLAWRQLKQACRAPVGVVSVEKI